MSRKRKNQSGLKTVLIILILLMIAATAFVIKMCIGLAEQAPETRPSGESSVLEDFRPTEPEETETEPPTTVPETEPERVVATATVGTMGDMLMHIQLFSSQYSSIANLGGGNYDFSPIFEYVTDTVSGLDYAIANLETTFGGDDYPYQGNPAFNCPDPLADALADAGYDMMLTANNHCSDTLMPGIKRTLDVVREAGMETLGTRLTEEEDRYTIVEVNGIRIGMVCYTYTMSMSGGKPSLNGGLPVEKPALVNWFSYQNLNGFYNELDGIYSDMMAEGAEATMMFIHWGDEYQLTENSYQNTIAQKLCDMGFDVIVGGHPHVVQPMELLESTADPEHKTVCIYSLGNSVSNQRLGNLKSVKTAHTEDGALFTVTFEKESDGSVYVAGTDVIPLWVNMHSDTGKREYNILPLHKEAEDTWAQELDLNAETLKAAQNSWQRTMDIVGAGLEECRIWLNAEKENRENPTLADAA